jgi:hypothetical protein
MFVGTNGAPKRTGVAMLETSDPPDNPEQPELTMNQIITSTDRAQYLTTTVQDLIKTVRRDRSATPILADALQDAGFENPTLTVLRSPIGSYELAEWLFDNLGVEIGTIRQDRLALAACEVNLSRANGRRRTRLLSLSHVAYAIKRARQLGTYYAIGGDTVANKYGYPSSRTMCLVAIRTDGSVRIGIVEGTANKGSSITNQVAGLRSNQSDELFRQWADQGQGQVS